MLVRRRWLQSTLLALTGFWWQRPVAAQEGNSFNSANRLSEQNIASLEDQLKNGLRTTTADQAQFIRVVVHHVDNGRIPRAMVNLVYKWAIERNPRVPYPYFRIALRELSRRRGVQLP